jgi:general secretion pathway protein G
MIRKIVCVPGFVKFRFGFTLLELLVVMAIIGMLAAYVGPKYFSQLGKSEQTTAKAQIESFEKALNLFRLHTGRFPTTAEGLGALMAKPVNVRGWSGPYLEKDIPPDPWGNKYLYRSPGARGKDFDVISYGSDGQPGGTDTAADISN